MSDAFPKFIIEDGNLIIAKCAYHKQLVIDKEKVKGGGWFKYEPETKTFTLYGSSEDFGTATIEDIRTCIKSGNVYSNKYCTHSIVDAYNFQYNTGSEIINLKTN